MIMIHLDGWLLALIISLSVVDVATSWGLEAHNLSLRTQITTRARTATIILTSTFKPQDEPNPQQTISTLNNRRYILSGLVLVSGLLPPQLVYAAKTESESLIDDIIYQKKTDQYAYEFQPPSDFEAGNKPLKTHLDEVNFQSKRVPGYQFGITVDPVRISSLQQFGTPEEVAAKVVMAEVNRDGVFEVKLMEDAVAGPDNDAYYLLNYLSTGKRGDKRFVAKFYIHRGMLYALTCQCKETDYPKVKDEMLAAAETFKTL